MENKKRLEVNAAICDARFVAEETLSAYERLEINCASLISSPEARALMGRHQVELNAAGTLDMDRDVRVSTVNGSMCLTPSQTAPEGRTFLVVNGSLDVAPGCEEALKNYAAIMVNGAVDAPESMAGLLTGLSVNGAIRTYPDGCIRLKSTVALDRTFVLRARQDALYYAASRIIALAEDIDFRKLAEKNVRFATKKLVIAEGLVEAALPLFDERTDIQILPDGCAWLDDDTVLDEAVVRRWGGKLYIDGDLTLLEDGPWLDKVAYLRVDGDVLAAKDLVDKLNAMDADYDSLYLVGGTLLTGETNIHLTRSMLECAERGLSMASCTNVTVDEDVPAQLLGEKLVSVIACVNVHCTEEQRTVIEPLAQHSMNIGPKQKKDAEEEDSNLVEINATFYTL